jgi:hypothetical protein
MEKVVMQESIVKVTSEDGIVNVRKRKSLKKEIAEIFKLSGTPTARLNLFLGIDTYKRPGATEVKNRKKIVQDRIKKIKGTKIEEPVGIPSWVNSPQRYREWKLIGCNREEVRAIKSGDAVKAIKLGESYHNNIQNLYLSKYAKISYGHGGKEHSDNTIYRGSFKGWYCNWKDGGARVDYPNGIPTIVLENYLGREKERFPLPKGDLLENRYLLGGDLFAVVRKISGQKIAVRYGIRKNKLYKNGIAVLVKIGSQSYWEHGNSVSEIRKEIAHKIETERKNQEQQQREEKEKKLIQRIIKLCPKLLVCYRDARLSGYCQAGIKGFMERHHILGTTVLAANLVETQETRKVVEAAALRVIKEAQLMDMESCRKADR